MRILFIVVISIILLITIFSFYITRNGKIVTPMGSGTISLSSGIYENFPLPDYAAKMVSPDYKSYFVEVEPGIKVHILEGTGTSSIFNAWESYLRFFVQKNSR